MPRLSRTEEPKALSAHEFGSIVSQVNLRDMEQQQQAVQVLIGVLSDSGAETGQPAATTDHRGVGRAERWTDVRVQGDEMGWDRSRSAQLDSHRLD